MKPYYQDNHNTLYCLDFRRNDLPDGCVQMVCTSPPYWGLRKYSGLPDLIWGGDEKCEHEWGEYIQPAAEGTRTLDGNSALRAGHQGTVSVTMRPKVSAFCFLCGAWKGSYGLEPTPEMYIEHTLVLLREIGRVLRKDGVVFWNIGDSYAGSGSPRGDFRDGKGGDEYLRPYNRKGGILKPKDLCLIPFRVAIAAQEDGWWVRSVIIWSKPNPMPESVTDRPTESHEYILMLTKSGKSLYWTHRDGGGTRQRPKADYRWVRYGVPNEKAIQKEIGGMARRNVWEERDGEDRGWRDAADRKHSDIIEEVAIEPPDWKVKIKCPECEGEGEVSVYLGLDVWQTIKCPTCNGKKETQLWRRINLWKGHDYYWDQEAVREPINPNNIGKVAVRPSGDSRTRDKEHWGVPHERGMVIREYAEIKGRNLRSVWTFPTEPYPEAHFAVFPEKLPELCIKAATPEVGCCSKCGAPWVRILEKKPSTMNIRVRDAKRGVALPEEGYKASPEEIAQYGKEEMGWSKTLGWRPTCKCNADKVPSIVLDPFAGTGTTLWVAKKLGRQARGYELSEEYCQLTVERNRQQVLV